MCSGRKNDKIFVRNNFFLFSVCVICQKLGVYVGKTENRRGTTSLFTRTFSRPNAPHTPNQFDSNIFFTNFVYVCLPRKLRVNNEIVPRWFEVWHIHKRSLWKRYLSQIDSVCEEHSASTVWKIIRSYGLSKKYKPTYDCSYVPE